MIDERTMRRARAIADKLNRDGIEGHGPYRQAAISEKGVEYIAKALNVEEIEQIADEIRSINKRD